MPVESILRFIADPAGGDLEALARRAAAARGGADPRLRRAAVTAALAVGPTIGPGRQPVLALAPAAADGGSRLADELLEALGDPSSLRPIKPRGVDPVAVRSWLAARQRDRRPALLAGPAAGLEGLLAAVERRGLRFRLPAGSSLLALRGATSVPDGELRRRLGERLGLAGERLWLAWEPPGAATPFLARWAEPARFAIPHWTRVAEGADGGLEITDLAAARGEIRLATGARGVVEADGFLLAG